MASNSSDGSASQTTNAVSSRAAPEKPAQEDQREKREEAVDDGGHGWRAGARLELRRRRVLGPAASIPTQAARRGNARALARRNARSTV
jgi:hypothetical protein